MLWFTELGTGFRLVVGRVVRTHTENYYDDGSNSTAIPRELPKSLMVNRRLGVGSCSIQFAK
jgi:hypothetical protein